MEKINVKAIIFANKQKVFNYYTSTEHIVNWNFASADWCCPKATNDLKVGGKYFARMEAKDGSFGFDFEATYTEMIPEERFSYAFGDRTATVTFSEIENGTEINLIFDPETINDVELQRKGWQAILDNFKKYTETN